MATQTYIALATTTLSSTTDTVSFQSIASTYRDLVVVVAGTTSNVTNIIIRLNNDSGSNYSFVDAYGNGSTASSASSSSTSEPEVGRFGTSQSITIAQIMDYSATDKHKTILGRGDANGIVRTKMSATRWASTAAVNRVDVISRPTGRPFSVGSTFSLFGIEA